MAGYRIFQLAFSFVYNVFLLKLVQRASWKIGYSQMCYALEIKTIIIIIIIYELQVFLIKIKMDNHNNLNHQSRLQRE